MKKLYVVCTVLQFLLLFSASAFTGARIQYVGFTGTKLPLTINLDARPKCEIVDIYEAISEQITVDKKKQFSDDVVSDHHGPILTDAPGRNVYASDIWIPEEEGSYSVRCREYDAEGSDLADEESEYYALDPNNYLGRKFHEGDLFPNGFAG